MKMKLLPTNADQEREKIWHEYAQTFPPEERRNKEGFEEVWQHEKYHPYALYQDENCVGYAFCWALENFVFLEHFEIFSPFRNQKLGGKALQTLQATFDNIILEAEPAHQSELANRRILFYQKHGFRILNKNYWQPPYTTDTQKVNLWLMGNFSPDHLKECERKIHQTVYGCP